MDRFRFLLVIALTVSLPLVLQARQAAGQDAASHIPFKNDDLYGYLSRNGEIVVEPQFDYGERFSEGLAAVRTADGKWGYIDETGAFAVKPSYGHAAGFAEGLGLVEKDGKFGFIDRAGEMVIEPQFDGGGSFNGGLANVLVGHEWGYIDTAGSFTIEPQFAGAETFHEGLARVCTAPEGERCFDSDDRKFGFIDPSGETVIPAQFDYAEHFSDGLAMARSGEMFGFIDQAGQWAIEPVYSNAASAFSEGLVLVTLEEGGMVFLNKEGQAVLQPPSDFYLGERLAGGLVIAMDPAVGKWGYMDGSGEMAIPVQYDRALPFDEGIAPVMLDGKWGLINRQGDYIVEPQFERIAPTY